MKKILVEKQGIRLGQFLKLADIVSTGGEAKMRVQSGEIAVNGQIETRRGLQLKNDDIVEVDGKAFVVQVESTVRSMCT